MRDRSDEQAPSYGIQMRTVPVSGSIAAADSVVFVIANPRVIYLNQVVTSVPAGREFEIDVDFDVIVNFSVGSAFQPGYSVGCSVTDGATIRAFDFQKNANLYPLANRPRGTFVFRNGAVPGNIVGIGGIGPANRIIMPNSDIILTFQPWYVDEMLPSAQPSY